MKRKIFRVLIALVLVVSFSMVMAAPAAATTYNVIPFTLQTGANAASWSDVQKSSGSYSALLNYVSGDNSYVEFTPPTGITVNDLATISDGWSWWYYASAAYGPLLELRFSAPGSGHVDITVDTAEVSPAITTGTTEEVTSASTCIYYGNDDTDQTSFSNVTGSVTLAGVLASIDAQSAMTAHTESAAAWELSRVRAEIGWVGAARTCYIDDIEIAGITYDLEGTATDYTVIQTAITAADPGDTITVVAGTYREDLSISTANLTLESVAGATTTTILCAGSVNDIVIVTAAGVTIDGFTIQGLSATGGARNGIDVRASGCTIQNNIFVDIYYDNIFVSGDMTSGTITNNTLTGMGTAAGRGAIWVESYAYDIAGITISNNIVSGYGGGYETIFVGQTLTGTVSDITVTGNSVTDCDYGLALDNDGSATTMDTINVTDNTFSQCGVGIAIWPEVTNEPTNVTITGNDITGNTAYGIRILSWDATNAINYNNITGNTVGLLNGDSVSVNATNNWWGNASRPVPDTLPETGYNSYGNTVDDASDVDYEPWLLAVVVSGTAPTTYDKTLALKDEWTLVSTDKEVTTGTAWVGTTILSGTDTILAYKYTPSSTHRK